MPEAIRPFFIGGCARSGTTMLGAMLGAHHDCLCTPESQFKTNVLGSFGRPIHEVDPREILRAIVSTRRHGIWGCPIDPAAAAAESLGQGYRQVIEFLVRSYGHAVDKPAFHAWVDHTPSNVRFSATLLDLFPDARFVHILRDGRAVASSLVPLDWGPSTVAEAASQWLRSVSVALAAETYLGPDRITRVRYEDLVRQPEHELGRIARFLGISYEPAMAEANGFRVPKYTEQQHALVGKRPDPSRIHAWREALSEREIEIYESIAGEHLRFLGYELCFRPKARKMTRVERLSSAVRSFGRKRFLDRVRRKRRRALG